MDSLKLIFRNIVTKEPKCRHWIVSEDRLQNYQKIQKDYKKIQAERDMWYHIAQDMTYKFDSTVEWINKNWRGGNEK